MPKWPFLERAVGWRGPFAFASAVSSPAFLFANGENGIWVEPGSGSLQDPAGPVLIAGGDDPVGFQIDRSKGARFAGGAFSGTQTLANNPEYEVDGDATVDGTLISASSALGGCYYQATVDAGLYFVEISVSRVSGSDPISLDYSTSPPAVDTEERDVLLDGEAETSIAVMRRWTAGGIVRFRIRSRDAGGNSWRIDSFSVKRVPGNHGVQATGSERPTLRTSPLHIESDGIDDALNWTAPEGTYTVARVNSSGTVTIQTGQSLSGATNILIESTIAGYVAVDRALTETETTALTAYLERLAA